MSATAHHHHHHGGHHGGHHYAHLGATRKVPRLDTYRDSDVDEKTIRFLRVSA